MYQPTMPQREYQTLTSLNIKPEDHIVDDDKVRTMVLAAISIYIILIGLVLLIFFASINSPKTIYAQDAAATEEPGATETPVPVPTDPAAVVEIFQTATQGIFAIVLLSMGVGAVGGVGFAVVFLRSAQTSPEFLEALRLLHRSVPAPVQGVISDLGEASKELGKLIDAVDGDATPREYQTKTTTTKTTEEVSLGG